MTAEQSQEMFSQVNAETLSQGCPKEKTPPPLNGPALAPFQMPRHELGGSPPEVWHQPQCSGSFREAAAGNISKPCFSPWEMQATYFHGRYSPSPGNH